MNMGSVIFVIANYIVANLLVIYAASVAATQYNLPWLPSLVGAGCALAIARYAARGLQ